MGAAGENGVRGTAAARGGRPKAAPNLVCPVCGESFHRAPSQIRGRTICCSKACSYIGRRTRGTQRCANPDCGREFEVERSRVENSSGLHYCSFECYQAVNRSEDLTCANPACGKPLRRRPSLRRQHRSPEFCCSYACRHELTLLHRAEREARR